MTGGSKITLSQQIEAVRVHLDNACALSSDLPALKAALRSLEWLAANMQAVRAYIAAVKAVEGPSKAVRKAVKSKSVPKGLRGYPEDFSAFWAAYPTTPIMSKKQAGDAWARLSGDDRAAAFEALAPFGEWLAKNPTYPVVHAVRYITHRRFDGFASSIASAASPQVFVEIGTHEWKAWQATRAKPWPQTTREGKQGWWFPSALPPEAS